MARGSKVTNKRNTRNRVQLKKKGSDESDEEYKVSEDEEFVVSEEEYCSSLAEEDSEESLGEYEEEEEDWSEKKFKKVGRPRQQKGFQGRRKNGVVKRRNTKVSSSEGDDSDDDDFAIPKQRKKTRLSRKEREDYDFDDLYGHEEDDFGDRRQRMPQIDLHDDSYEEIPRKKNKVSYREESDYGDSEDDDDEEFTPNEVDGLDDEEESPVTKKNKMGRPRMQETWVAKGQRKKRKHKVLKRTKRSKPVKEQVLRKKQGPGLGKEYSHDNHTSYEKRTITERGRGKRRKMSIDSDSDFAISGPSDYEFTISEEEREQIREASEFCKRLNSNLRSSSAPMIIKQENVVSSRKQPVRKGKEKMVDLKVEVGKQVCGICLSEEGKRTIRGILNCCSHYFCFACIMEWSKVESRCPLCKQRFETITRTARADGGHDLRDAVIAVPERDQVYQPSEEELRGYLDPYENVICTECEQGGDDAHMLLCDLCDSPAHTYCVGLGLEVPDGNWYCDSCRPTALASANSQSQNPTSDHRLSNDLSLGSSPVASVRETFDLNEMYVPETPSSQATDQPPLHRHSIGDSQAASLASGAGASTLFDRRRIQRQIHQFLNNRSRQSDRSNGAAQASGTILFGSQIGQDVMVAPQRTFMSPRMAPQNSFQQGRLPEYGTPSLNNREIISPRFSSLRGQALRDHGSTSMDHSFIGLSHGEFGRVDASIGGSLGHQQVHPCSGRSNAGVGASVLPFQETTVPSRAVHGSLHTPF